MITVDALHSRNVTPLFISCNIATCDLSELNATKFMSGSRIDITEVMKHNFDKI